MRRDPRVPAHRLFVLRGREHAGTPGAAAEEMTARRHLFPSFAFAAFLSCTADGTHATASSASSVGSAPPGSSAGADSGAAQDLPSPADSRLTDVAFYTGLNGPRVLVAGSDAASAIEMVHLVFYGSDGLPVAVDLDHDGTIDDAEVDAFVSERGSNGDFFVEIQSAAGFDAVAKQVMVTPVGAMAPTDEHQVAALRDAPVRALGDSCDPRGFDLCVETATCAPADPKSGASNRCRSSSDYRDERCANAPRLDAPATGSSTFIDVTASGVSSWNPPDGCASADRRDRPEALVWLHVPAKTSSLTLSTENPSASGGPVDTVLYVLSSCAADSADALACNDDVVPPYSSLTLHDVGASDLLVVVDTLGYGGGPARLRVATP